MYLYGASEGFSVNLKEKSSYDVVIVGGGPAGSTAGFILSNLGFKVVIIDKSIFPRQKLCGGLITLKTLKLLNRVFSMEERLLKDNRILNFQSNSYEIFYRNNRVVKRHLDIP